MPVKIRLQRHGKKGKPFFWIVAADTRAKRDGKFLDKLGIYNPNTNPATIELDVDGAVKWLLRPFCDIIFTPTKIEKLEL